MLTRRWKRARERVNKTKSCSGSNDKMTIERARTLEKEHLFSVYSTIRQPMVLERGEGVYLYDTDGKRYLDLVSGGRAVTGLGHCPEPVVQAICEQAATLIHVSNDFFTPVQLEASRMLTSLMPGSRAFFCNSGAEANEAAIKLARKHAKQKHGPDKFEIITSLDSFHGRTLATITATGQPKYQKGFEPLVEGFSYIPFNDVAALRSAVTEKTCAVMLEPVLGEAGVFPATQEFLQTARQVCNEHGALLVLDEVQTGVGRTGKMFAYQHYGVEPDIVALAKGLGAGFPMGAILAREEVAATFAPGDHASTFGGNPLACAAAVATLKMIKEERLVERAAERGQYLAAALGELRSHPLVREVRCIGLMAGVDLTQPVAAAVKEACRVAGVLIASVGDSTLRILPPMIISTEQIDQGVKVLREALAAAA